MQFDDLPVLPTLPGEYIFRGKTDVPSYIGKANNLRSRVGQHFKAGGKSGRFTREFGIRRPQPAEAAASEHLMDGHFFRGQIQHCGNNPLVCRDHLTAHPQLRRAIANLDHRVARFHGCVGKEGETVFGFEIGRAHV